MRVVLLLVVSVAAACAAPVPEDGRREAIVGGMVEPGEEAVVLVLPFLGISRCTGTLITDRVVLTAKHCVQAPGVDVPYRTTTMSVGVGPRFGAHTEYDVRRIVTTPGRYTASPTTGLGGELVGKDVALITLRDPVPGIVPIPVRRQSPMELVGDDFTAIGYGQTPDGGSGVKYRTTGRVTGISANVIYGAMTICSGDSGGPIILEGADRRVFGVASFGEAEACPSRQDGWNAVDAYLGMIDEAIYESGGCPEMRAETCNSVDDDCNGEVDEGCIPLGGTCTRDDDCAFAQLPAWFEPLEAPARCADTRAGRICTRPCDPLQPATGCGTTVLPFTGEEVATPGVYCGRDVGCAGTCLPGAAGAGADGADCTADTDCASLMCFDPGDGSSECAAPCRGDAGLCVAGDVCVGIAEGCGGCLSADRVRSVRGVGETCAVDADCGSGRCWTEAGTSYCTQPCAEDGDCGGAAFHCRPEDGVCILGERSRSGGACLGVGDCLVGDFCSREDSDGWCTHGCSVDMACPDGFVCGAVGGANACVPAGGRRRLGESCAADAECIDGTCQGACVRPCGGGTAFCPTGFECRREADGVGAQCRLPGTVVPGGGGGDVGCSIGGGAAGRASMGWLAIGALVMLVRARRRR